MPKHDGPWPQGTPCWVDCQVDDPGAAREFYSALFGWDVEDSTPEAGGYLMAMVDGAPAAGIGPKPMPMQSVWTTYLAADSADDIHAKIVAAGGTAMMEPFDVMDVGRMFVATDPSGAAFGVWEAKSHAGAGVYNEPGAYTWNEVQTRDFDAVQKFYQQVFGYDFRAIGDGPEFRYAELRLPGSSEPAAGMNDLTRMPGETPSHWLTWFNVADLDATVDKAKGSGATVLSEPSDSPFGRMAILAAPQGEAFGVIDPSTTVGEPPEPGDADE